MKYPGALARVGNDRPRQRQFAQWQEFTLTCSCPPDTQLHLREGHMWQGSYAGSGEGWKVGSISWDLAELANISYTVANSYVGVVMTLKYGGYNETTPRFFWDDVEYTAAQDAENAAVATLQDEAPAYEDYPLAIVILRNNGDIAAPNSFLAIDAVNRGRSYLWKDVRPTHWA